MIYKPLALTFALSRDFITKYIGLMDIAKLLKHDFEVGFVHRPRHLAHKHLDGIRIRLAGTNYPAKQVWFD